MARIRALAHGSLTVASERRKGSSEAVVLAIRATPLLLCEHVYKDAVSHNVTLLGIFTTLRATKFPTPFRVISVMDTQENQRNADGQSIPESEPLLVVRSDVGQYVSKQDDGAVKTASEPLASFTMKCSKPNQGQ